MDNVFFHYYFCVTFFFYFLMKFYLFKKKKKNHLPRPAMKLRSSFGKKKKKGLGFVCCNIEGPVMKRSWAAKLG